MLSGSEYDSFSFVQLQGFPCGIPEEIPVLVQWYPLALKGKN